MKNCGIIFLIDYGIKKSIADFYKQSGVYIANALGNRLHDIIEAALNKTEGKNFSGNLIIENSEENHFSLNFFISSLYDAAVLISPSAEMPANSFKTYYQLFDELNKVVCSYVLDETKLYDMNLKQLEFANYIDPISTTKVTGRTPDERIYQRYLLWIIERYFVSDQFRKDTATELFHGFCRDEFIYGLDYNRNSFSKRFNTLFSDYLVGFWGITNKTETTDTKKGDQDKLIDIDYYSKIFGHNGLIENLKNKKIIDLSYKKSDPPHIIIACIRVAAFIKGFELKYGYNIVKILTDPDYAYVRNDERGCGNGIVLEALLNRLSLALNPVFLYSLNSELHMISANVLQIINAVYTHIFKSTNISRYKKEKPDDCYKNIIIEMHNLANDTNQISPDYSHNVFESFYMRVLLYEYTISQGLCTLPDPFISRKESNSKYIDQFLSFQIDKDQAERLRSQSISLNFSCREYEKLDLLDRDSYDKYSEGKTRFEREELKRAEGDELIKKATEAILKKAAGAKDHAQEDDSNSDSTCDENDICTDAPETIAIPEPLPNFIKADDNCIELIDFYKKNKSDIIKFIESGNGKKKVSRDNILDNYKHVFYMINVLCGDRTDGLTVFLCFFLYYSLEDLRVRQHMYNSDRNTEPTVKSNIAFRQITLKEKAGLMEILNRMLICVSGESGNDIITEIYQELNDHITSFIVKDDVYLTNKKLASFCANIEAWSANEIKNILNNKASKDRTGSDN